MLDFIKIAHAAKVLAIRAEKGALLSAVGMELPGGIREMAQVEPRHPVLLSRHLPGSFDILSFHRLVLVGRAHVVVEVVSEVQGLEVLLGAADLDLLRVA